MSSEEALLKRILRFELGEMGFTDEQIAVAAQVVGYFNYINRIADGLGVDLEDRMTMSVEDWLEQKTDFRDTVIP